LQVALEDHAVLLLAILAPVVALADLGQPLPQQAAEELWKPL
jgi:hypothetical protein